MIHDLAGDGTISSIFPGVMGDRIEIPNKVTYLHASSSATPECSKKKKIMVFFWVLPHVPLLSFSVLRGSSKPRRLLPFNSTSPIPLLPFYFKNKTSRFAKHTKIIHPRALSL